MENNNESVARKKYADYMTLSSSIYVLGDWNLCFFKISSFLLHPLMVFLNANAVVKVEINCQYSSQNETCQVAI